MKTFVMVQCGQVIIAEKVVEWVTVVSTKVQQDSSRTIAVAIFRAVITLAFGAIGVVVMEQ